MQGELHHGDYNFVISVSVTSPNEGGVFGGRGADTATCKKRQDERNQP